MSEKEVVASTSPLAHTSSGSRQRRLATGLIVGLALLLSAAALWRAPVPTSRSLALLTALARRPAASRRTGPHPLLPLLRSARVQYHERLGRQSQSSSRAIAAYRARYRRAPPPGFDRWLDFARQRNHTFVDEYDSLMADIAPFARLSPAVLRQRTRTLAKLPGVSIVSITGGQSQVHSKSGRWAPALAFQEMISSFAHELPDMEVAINERLEARILAEQRHELDLADWAAKGAIVEPVLSACRLSRAGSSRADQTDPMASVDGFRVEWRGDGSTWEVFRRACPPDAPARRLTEALRATETTDRTRPPDVAVGADVAQVSGAAGLASRRRPRGGAALPPTREVTFNPALDARVDICYRPSLHNLHSAFFTDTRPIPHLYPLFSPSKPSGYADVRIPSHHYWSPSSEYLYDAEVKKGTSRSSLDPSWDEKRPTVFWRGKVTRGTDTPEGHASSFQKQRMVRFGNDDGRPRTSPLAQTTEQGPPLPIDKQPLATLLALEPATSHLLAVSAPLGAINNLTMDVAMACDPRMGECVYQRSLGLRIETPGPLSEAWRHKYVLDLDEVGFSPRFLALMESRSAVVKSSIQREFWESWAVPWYHFIPLSSSFAELPNIRAFFSGIPPEIAPRPADQAEASLALQARADEAAGAESTRRKVQATAVRLTSVEPARVAPVNPAHGDVFDGDRALRDIADAGTAFVRRHVRRADMESYVFRLLLEWARLLDEGTG